MGAVQNRPQFGLLNQVFPKGIQWPKFAGNGAKVRVWKQDPTVDAVGIRTAWIPTDVKQGPQDDSVRIQGAPAVAPDADGNFLVDGKKKPDEFDAVHTFAVVRMVLTMYQRAIKRMGLPQDVTWQWGNGAPINVFPKAGNMANAYYSRQDQALKFFYFNSPKNKERINTCRSWDIVSHETGHAVLDGLKPGYLSSWNPQTGGLHESFGDITAIFSLLQQLDMCETVIAESKGNLHDKGFFPALAEQFGDAIGRENGLRNADNDLKLSDVGTEVHDISQVFTGAIYDILADMYQDSVKLDHDDPAVTLYNAGDHLQAILLAAILRSPNRNTTYKDVAQNMIALETNPKWKDFIRKRFTDREVLGQNAVTMTPKKLSFKNCCPTLQRREHTKLFNEAIRDAKAQNLSMTV